MLFSALTLPPGISISLARAALHGWANLAAAAKISLRDYLAARAAAALEGITGGAITKQSADGHEIDFAPATPASLKFVSILAGWYLDAIDAITPTPADDAALLAALLALPCLSPRFAAVNRTVARFDSVRR